MKKIIALILSVVLTAAILIGCSGAPLIILHETLPWSIDTLTVNEESTYRITKYLGNCDDVDLLEDNVADKPKEITDPRSNVVYSLYEGYGIREENNKLIPYKSDETKGLTLLKMVFTVWYLDEAFVPDMYSSATFGGIPETIRSFAVFDRFDMSAKFTYREANIIQLPGEKLNHKMWVDYSGDVLGKKVARIQYPPYNDASPITESTIQKTEHIDNEYLFYYLRALTTTDGTADSTLSFNFSLPYENLLKEKKVKPRSLVSSTSKEAVALSPNILSSQEFNIVYNYFNFDDMPKEQKDNENDKFKISAYTMLKLDEKQSGPILKVYYSRYPTKENREESLQSLRKVLMQVKTYTYGGISTTKSGSTYYDAQKLESSVVYQLLNYSQRVAEPQPFI